MFTSASPAAVAVVRAPGRMLFENAYVWFIFISAMDIMMTWAVLHQGGAELNPIADAVIRWHGLWGLIGFKFSLVVLIVLICETLGRRHFRIARRVAHTCIAVTAVPVALSFAMLLVG